MTETTPNEFPWAYDAEGYLQTFVIVTRAANAMMTPIHDRIPAILESDVLALWLNPKTAAKNLAALLGGRAG